MIRREDAAGPIPQPASYNVIRIPLPALQADPAVAEAIEQAAGGFLKHIVEEKCVSYERDRYHGDSKKDMLNAIKGALTFGDAARQANSVTARMATWFASTDGWQVPIVPTLLDTYFEKDMKLTKHMGWGKDGALFLDVSPGDKGVPVLSIWVLLTPIFVEKEFGVKLEVPWSNKADRGIKLRFRLDSIVDDEALFEVVAETTEKTRIKEVFTSNGFRDCDAAMAKEITAVLADLPKKGDKSTDLSKMGMDRVIKMTIEDAFQVKDSEEYKEGKSFSKDNKMFGKWRGSAYTQASDAFARWYFLIMQQCTKSSAEQLEICQRWQGAFGDHDLSKTRPSTEYKINY